MGAVVLLVFAGASGARTASAKTGSITLNDQTWTCNTAVDLDSVTVTIGPNAAPTIKAILLKSGCTGVIRSITVVQYQNDGIATTDGAHDLTIGGGSITCLARGAQQHQDGIQAMSGSRITFKNLVINCPTANNADFYVNWSGVPGTGVPRSITCNGCYLYGTTSWTVFIGRSYSGGVLYSTICPSNYLAYRNPGGGVDVGNTYPTSC
jgi:hypothetical protein